jgi:hypothetical protein
MQTNHLTHRPGISTPIRCAMMGLALMSISSWLSVGCSSASPTGNVGHNAPVLTLGDASTSPPANEVTSIGKTCGSDADCPTPDGAYCDSFGFCTKICQAYSDCGCPEGTTNEDFNAGKCNYECASTGSTAYCYLACTDNGDCGGEAICVSSSTTAGAPNVCAPPSDGGDDAGEDAGAQEDAGSPDASTGQPVGGVCASDDDCDSGLCALPGGWCTEACASDADCSDATAFMVCVAAGMNAGNFCFPQCPTSDFCVQEWGPASSCMSTTEVDGNTELVCAGS